MTIRDLTHQVVRADELRVGDIVVEARAGRVIDVNHYSGGSHICATCELGERWYEPGDPVDVYREVERDCKK